jgi:trk system potassium uptake protein TrkA
MRVIIVGCGRVGAELASILSRRDHDVTVIDHVGSSFQHLDPGWRGRTIEAEPLAEGVLERAGIREADAVATVTNSDAVNAVVAHVARATFRVPSVVSRNYDPRWRSLHETLGLQMVSSTAWGAQRIEELMESSRLRSVFSAGNGEIEVYELVVTAAWAGRSLAALTEGVDCAIVSLTRGGRASRPAGETPLAADDLVHVAAGIEGADRLRRRLEGEA